MDEEPKDLRCPRCLATSPAQIVPGHPNWLKCEVCKYHFHEKAGVELDGDAVAGEADEVEPPEPPRLAEICMLVCFGLLGFAGVLVERGMKGPAFLGFYAMLFVGVYLMQHVYLHVYSAFNTNSTVFHAIVVFEFVGAWRWFQASQRGMHKFGFLFVMMFVGLILLLLRANVEGSGGSMWSTSSCSSSSCGGGCGGGCGGCGGCG